MFDSLAMFESPVQIMIVLLIALIVFGPKRLPELGKQLGSGLRELNKAKNDLLRSMNTEHEPDNHDPYNYNYPSGQDTPAPYNGYSSYDYKSEPDLTDYTIAGQPPATEPAPGAVARSGNGASSARMDYSDYSIAPSALPSGSEAAHSGVSHSAASESKGEQHV